MNLFGKILVVLILVMSLTYMGLTVSVYATHQNWRVVAKEYETQVIAQLRKNDVLTVRFNSLKTEIDQLRKLKDNEVAALQTKKTELEGEVKKRTDEIATITTDKANTTAAIEKLTAEIAKKTTDVDTLTKALSDAKFQSEEYYKNILSLTDQLAQLGAEVAKARNANKDLVAENAKLKVIIVGHNIDINSPIVNTPPKVDGYVKASTTDGLVEISLGSDDGLTRGHTLEVYRPGATAAATKYLGRIEILQTKADVSVGKVIPQYRRGNIEKDDRVATRFN
jgi:chromosome segregation ATPase